MMPCHQPSSATSLNYDYYGRPVSHSLGSTRYSMLSQQVSQDGWSSRPSQGPYGWSNTQPLAFDPKNWSASYIPSPPSSTKAGSTGSWVEQASLKSSYYLDRGNGKVTRLVPADQLPPMNEIPRMENKSQGMDVLPPLPGNGRVVMGDTHQAITFKVGHLPSYRLRCGTLNGL